MVMFSSCPHLGHTFLVGSVWFNVLDFLRTSVHPLHSFIVPLYFLHLLSECMPHGAKFLQSDLGS
ncbi:MAG: hypothetical protein IJ456_00210 [Bacteroides sp.]|nr:hypothetical protein [Bacteroides sp.]